MKARLVSELDARHRIILAPPAAAPVNGDGSLDIVCGACGSVLIQRTHPYLSLQDIVIRCPRCKRCNGAVP